MSESATKKYEHARKGALGADIKNFMKSYFVDHAKNIFDGFLAARKGNIFGAGKALYSIIDDGGFIDRSKSAKIWLQGYRRIMNIISKYQMLIAAYRVRLMFLFVINSTRANQAR